MMVIVFGYFYSNHLGRKQ